MVTLPTTLLLLPIISLFALCQNQIAQNQITYEIARFAALADVSSQEVEDYRMQLDESAQVFREFSTGTCVELVSISKEHLVPLWPVPIPMISTGRASCEIDN